MTLKVLILAGMLLTFAYLPAAAISKTLPSGILKGITNVNELIQEPFRNSPWFKKTAEIINVPDKKAFSWLKSAGIFFQKLWESLSGFFKLLGSFFVWTLEFVAKLIKIGINQW